MVTETLNLVPLTPEWMERNTTAGGVRNINDIYWKRGPNEVSPNWILVGPSAIPGPDGKPATAQAESWKRKGRTPLIEYSYTAEVSPITGKRETIETSKDRLNTPEGRWYWFFKNGGAPLFPIDQIVTYHWHIKPPYGLAKEVFPQLDEWEVPEPKWCAACPGERPPKNSDEEIVTHAMVHHRMTEPQARDLLKFADHPPVGAAGLNIRRKAQRIEHRAEEAGISPLDMPSPEALVQPKLHICNFCGQDFPRGLAMHEKHCKSRPQGESGGQADQAIDDSVMEETAHA